MIEVRYKGQLGNNLFQYCLGRLLAGELGLALRAAPISGFPGTAAVVDGACHDGAPVTLTGQRVDFDALRVMPAPHIVIDGWFQRYDYYRPHRAAIRQWLTFDASVPAPAQPPDTVIHVRRHDYVRNGWALPFSFYEEALSLLAPQGEVWIVTDDPRDPFFDRFQSWRPRFTGGSTLSDLRFMCAARRLIMSQSTYSWWASFLGETDQVVCPEPSFGAWSVNGEDASLIERDRFICLPVAAPYQPSWSEWWHQRRQQIRPAIARAVRQVVPVPTLSRPR